MKNKRKRQRNTSRRASLKWAARFHGQYVRILFQGQQTPQTHHSSVLRRRYWEIANQHHAITAGFSVAEWFALIWPAQSFSRNGYGLVKLGPGLIYRHRDEAQLEIVSTSDLVMARLKQELPTMVVSSDVPPALKGAIKYWDERRLILKNKKG